VATGIVNIWMHEAEYVARGCADLERDHPGRFALGLGASHAPVVDADSPGRYSKPYSAMRTYLKSSTWSSRRSRPPSGSSRRSVRG
jgi:alkanesulfonate monooxygenase SsuD/methylene tetrahydromethanopterin reductase-like flavin-dependent oxidoreductase (luciferase family)